MNNNCLGCDRDCPERRPGCHDSCEKYQAAKRKYLAEKEMITKKKLADADLKGARSDAIKRCAGASRRR